MTRQNQSIAFRMMCGGVAPMTPAWLFFGSGESMEAINAARSARFEHGEVPA